MLIPMTSELRQALAEHPGEPLELRDEAANQSIIVIPLEQFERLKPLLAADLQELRATYAAQEIALGQAGWDDPAMDIYNDYDAHRP